MYGKGEKCQENYKCLPSRIKPNFKVEAHPCIDKSTVPPSDQHLCFLLPYASYDVNNCDICEVGSSQWGSQFGVLLGVTSPYV